MNKFFWTNVEAARNDLPVTHDTFRRKKDEKAVSSKVPVPPLSRQRHNAPLGYFTSPHLALGAIWVWDPCSKGVLQHPEEAILNDSRNLSNDNAYV